MNSNLGEDGGGGVCLPNTTPEPDENQQQTIFGNISILHYTQGLFGSDASKGTKVDPVVA